MFVYDYADVLLPRPFALFRDSRFLHDGITRQKSSGEDESTTVELAGAPFVDCGVSRAIRGATGRRRHCVHI